MLLEGLAERHGPVAADPALYAIAAGNELDLTPLIARLAAEPDPAFGAALFHATLVAALADWITRGRRGARPDDGRRRRRLSPQCDPRARLARDARRTELTLLEAQAVPPNDGGLALGQAWVALKTVNGRG